MTATSVACRVSGQQ